MIGSLHIEVVRAPAPAPARREPPKREPPRAAAPAPAPAAGARRRTIFGLGQLRSTEIIMALSKTCPSSPRPSSTLFTTRIGSATAVPQAPDQLPTSTKSTISVYLYHAREDAHYKNAVARDGSSNPFHTPLALSLCLRRHRPPLRR